MARPIKLTANEVSTLAQLVGVPPYLAVAIWQQGGFGKSVDELHDGLTQLAEEYRSTGDWTEAASSFFANFDDSELVAAPPEELKRPVYKRSLSNQPQSYSDFGPEPDEPYAMDAPLARPNILSDYGFPSSDDSESDVYDEHEELYNQLRNGMEGYEDVGTRPQLPQNFNNFDAALNQQGSDEYDTDRYIRRLVEEEFNNA